MTVYLGWAPINAGCLSWSSTNSSVATGSVSGGTLSVSGRAAGQATITGTHASGKRSPSISVQVQGTGGTGGTGSTGVPIAWSRLYGKGRYDTMAAIACEGWRPYAPMDPDEVIIPTLGWEEEYYKDTALVAVIATGESFKDALSAAGLAGIVHGPVVLVNGKKDSLNAQAREVLTKLRPRGAFIIGAQRR